MTNRPTASGVSAAGRQRIVGLPVALFVLLWLAAVVPGLSGRHVSGPYDVDGFRDVAIAQGVRDGLWASDPLYRGEGAWYPPLVPAATALTARVLDLEMSRAYVVTGLWLNAFIPPAFFACAWRLIGPWPALAATCAFLFLPGRPPAWASATYSPWLFPSVAAQVPLYVGVWAWARTLDSPSLGRTVVVGILLGLTFLAHSAAAVVLGGIVVLTALWRTAEIGGGRILALAVASCAIAALVVAPFLAPIGLRYGFAVLNRAPTAWAYDNAAPSVLLAALARPSSIVGALLLVVGAVWGRSLLTRAGRVVLVAWVVVAGACLAYGFLAERWAALPTVVPAYHFLFLLRAAKWLIFGCGFIAVANGISRRLPLRVAAGRVPHLPHAVLVTLLALGIHPRYLGREAFTTAPRQSADAVTPSERATQTWIGTHSDRSAVFLCSDMDALQLVAPAGRYVVSVQRYFSNPYVRYEDRAAARDRMLGALLTGDHGAFEATRPQFGVSHVLVRGDEARAILEHSADLVRQVHQAGEITVFDLR